GPSGGGPAMVPVVVIVIGIRGVGPRVAGPAPAVLLVFVVPAGRRGRGPVVRGRGSLARQGRLGDLPDGPADRPADLPGDGRPDPLLQQGDGPGQAGQLGAEGPGHGRPSSPSRRAFRLDHTWVRAFCSRFRDLRAATSRPAW